MAPPKSYQTRREKETQQDHRFSCFASRRYMARRESISNKIELNSSVLRSTNCWIFSVCLSSLLVGWKGLHNFWSIFIRYLRPAEEKDRESSEWLAETSKRLFVSSLEDSMQCSPIGRQTQWRDRNVFRRPNNLLTRV